MHRKHRRNIGGIGSVCRHCLRADHVADHLGNVAQDQKGIHAAEAIVGKNGKRHIGLVCHNGVGKGKGVIFNGGRANVVQRLLGCLGFVLGAQVKGERVDLACKHKHTVAAILRHM